MTDQLAAEGVDDTTQDPTSDADADDQEVVTTGTPASAAWFGRRADRVSRWDRESEPRDWRFYVARTGTVMIATGLLLFGFVAYQLWGTGIETARAQNQLENEFDQLLAEFADGDVDVRSIPIDDVDADGTDAGELDPAVRPPTDAAESTGRTGDEPSVVADRRDVAADEDVVVPTAVDLSDEAVVHDPIPQPVRGDPLLRLEIPAIGRDDIVVPGVSLNDLKDGPGHYPDTPLPGQLGNAAIAGHRTTYGAPFFDVDQLTAGDEIITTLLNGDRFVYEVTFTEVVSASDYYVVTTANPDIAELTLTSCHPKYTARDRIVVHTVLNPEKSSNVGVPTFYSLDADPDDAPIPGDDPVLTAADADPDDAEVGEPDPARAEADETSSGEIPIATGAVNDDDGSSDAASAATDDDRDDLAAPTPDEAPEPIDAFSEGWFDDPGAFPQLALWGLALALISVLAHRISRRFRNLAAGFALGVVPFLVALYFFYQNVNRLLPPGI